MIVPAPLRMGTRSGEPFVVGPTTPVLGDPGTEGVARRLAGRLGMAGSAAPSPERAAISLRLTTDPALAGVADDVPPELVREAYRLEVDAHGAVVTAVGLAGLSHGATTLALLAEGGRTGHGHARGEPLAVPALTVLDVPRFAWRGLHLDVARHFFGVDAVATVLDVMADLKLNVLHLHLSDDQGWRLEIPSRPELTARSAGTAVGGDPGGFYTVADYRRILGLAADRHITVVPEIDLPGHTNAALHALGELTPSGEPEPAYTGIDVGFSRLRADVPATEPFLRDVLGDVAAMTPGPWLHIGGDEALALEHAEYRRLVETATAIVAATGKRVVGWQEVATTSLPPGAVVQYWDEREGAAAVVEAARAGARVVLSPAGRVYLDMKYDATTRLGLEWAGHVPLRRSYDWDPAGVLPDLPAGAVLGVEACLWTETVRDLDDLAYLLLPRLAAVAEVAWSAAACRSWEGFTRRIGRHAPRWSAAGLTWFRAGEVDWSDAGA